MSPEVFIYNEDIKRCPFCGREAWIQKIEFNDGDIWFRPECSYCGCGWKFNYPTVELAVEAWNGKI
jgi:hypothetical protein